jgi:DNA-binding ferritin-like protein
LSCL